jgi:CheY-like chemotaxis protein
MRAAIFVIDDRLAEAQATKRLFESRGHEVTIETDGKRAIQILRGPSLFDVSFLDLLMPDVNGEQIYRALRMYAPARLKRLVFFTGMAYLAESWLARTGIPVIEKGPESPVALIATVEQFAKLSCTRGPQEDRSSKRSPTVQVLSRSDYGAPYTDHTTPREHMTPPRPSSHPDLDALYDEDMEINTDMIQLAQKKGVSSSFITELRIRYLHTNHKALKEDIIGVKGDVTEVKGAVAKVATYVAATNVSLGTLKTEIATAIKTSFRWLGFIVIVLGGGGTALGWLIEHFLLKK